MNKPSATLAVAGTCLHVRTSSSNCVLRSDSARSRFAGFFRIAAAQTTNSGDHWHTAAISAPPYHPLPDACRNRSKNAQYAPHHRPERLKAAGHPPELPSASADKTIAETASTAQSRAVADVGRTGDVPANPSQTMLPAGSGIPQSASTPTRPAPRPLRASPQSRWRKRHHYFCDGDMHVLVSSHVLFQQRKTGSCPAASLFPARRNGFYPAFAVAEILTAIADAPRCTSHRRRSVNLPAY